MWIETGQIVDKAGNRVLQKIYPQSLPVRSTDLMPVFQQLKIMILIQFIGLSRETAVTYYYHQEYI